MAINIDAVSFRNAGEVTCHLLPCTVNANAKANVGAFFETTIRTENESLTSSFRGRPLYGQEVTLPEGFIGVVLREHSEALLEEEIRQIAVEHHFSKFTAWNLDKIPSGDDKLNKALRWISISKALQRPVDQESSQRSVSGK